MRFYHIDETIFLIILLGLELLGYVTRHVKNLQHFFLFSAINTLNIR